MRRRYVLAALAVPLASALFVACGGDDSTSSGSTSHVAATGTFHGTVSDKKENGTLDLTITTSSSTASTHGLSTGATNVTGVLTFNGVSIAISGNYDGVGGAFSASGSGYSFTGSATSTSISGTFQGPFGAGSFVLVPASAGTVELFCGIFTGDDDGNWNISAVHGGVAVGSWADTQGTAGTFAGTWGTANDLTLDGTPISATGTLASNTSGSGTWTNGALHGTWQTGVCQIAGPVDSGTDATTTNDAGADAGTEDGGASDSGTEGGHPFDGGGVDSGGSDGGSTDGGGTNDGSADDAGTTDAGATDSGSIDSGSNDSGAFDGGSADDAAVSDSGATDSGATDAGLAAFLTSANICDLAGDSTYLYIGHCKGAGISRIAYDGTGGEQNVVLSGTTTGMVTDGTNVYWIDGSGGGIRSAAVGSVSQIGNLLVSTSTAKSQTLVTDGTDVYWADGTGASEIHRAPVSGQTDAASTAFVTGEVAITSLAVDTTHSVIYWTADGTAPNRTDGGLRYASLGGAGVATAFEPFPASNVVFDVTNGLLLYNAGGALYHVGPNIALFQIGTDTGAELHLTSSLDKLYYSDSSGLYRTFATQNLSPTQITPFVANTATPSAPVVGGTYVFWRSQDGKSIYRAPE